jgi:hypothetical protein
VDEFKSVHLRHHQVEQDQSGHLFRHSLQPNAAVGGQGHAPAGPLHGSLHQRGGLWVVLDDQQQIGLGPFSVTLHRRD